MAGGLAKALNLPLGEYGRKTEIQKNWRENTQSMAHVV